MHILRPRPAPPRWLRLPRRSARLRLTVLYGAAFLACGAAVLGLTYLLYGRTVDFSKPSYSGAPASYFTVPVADAHRAGPDEVIPYLGVSGASLTVPVADAHRAGPHEIVTVPVPKASLEADLRNLATARLQLLIASAVALGVFVAAAAAVGWVIAGRVLRPLSAITAAARRISASSLHERLALRGPDDELKELADTLDGLFARLDAAFDAQRRFAANASHELRTPLTRERALLQVTLADPAASTGTWQAVSRELLASNAEQERLIEALLTLASSEAGPGEPAPVDLAATTSAALAAARPAISRLGLHVKTDIQAATLDGDPLLIQQLVANLIDNAVRHNIPGGDIEIATRAGRAGAVLSVTSSGQVIPSADVDRLFQPFQRLGPRPARRDGGHGLGLSIVRAIATAHGATIAARPGPEGGLAVDVTFSPPSGPPAACGIRPETGSSRTSRVPPAPPAPPQLPAAATPGGQPAQPPSQLVN